MLTEGILLLKRDYATEYFSRLDHYTSPANVGKIDDFLKQHFESKIAAAKDIYSFDGVDAHIRISGPMSPAGPDLYDIFYSYGGVSFADINAAMDIAREDVDPTKGKVFFDFNCPGSTVDGVDQTHQSIVKLSETHETVAVNHGMIASGAMWLASACHSITSTTPVAFTGSIGVIVAGFDISEMLDKMGVKKVVITNHEATEKRADISTTEGQKIIQDELQAIYEVFKSRVLEGRPKMTAKSIDDLKGSVKIASEAIAIGLIDEPTNKTETPAAGGNKPTGEVIKMTLKELLAANPAAQTEHDNIVMTARSEGEATGKSDASKVWDAAAPILASADYPQAIKDRVIAKAQKCDHEGLLDFVALHDMNAEGKKEEAAEGEQSDETPPTPPDNKKEDGSVSSAADLGDAVNSFKSTYGGGSK